MKRASREKLIRTLIVVIFLAILLFPVLILINTSLQSHENIKLWPPRFFQEFRFENYREAIFGEKSIMHAFSNSLQISVITMVLCIVVGMLAAYSVTRFDFKGKKLFLILIIVTQMFSPVILVNPMYVIFREMGLLNTKLALIIASTASSLPMTVWLLYSYFSQIPIEYEEAAWMDGATRLRGVFNFILPIAIPGIITAGLFAFIMAWGDLVFARSFILSPELRTVSIALTSFQDLYKTSWETQMAASVITAMPTFIIFILIQNHLVKGMTSQGVKG